MSTARKISTFFSYGFRPFFLFASLFAFTAVPLWMLTYTGEIALNPAMPPREWHIHELLFGYLSAVIAGFLFTAVPNWTGRPPIKGLPLACLAALWVGGRLIMIWPGWLGPTGAMLIETSFLAVLLAVFAREILAARNLKNIRVLLPITILLIANVTFHLEVLRTGSSDYGQRLGFTAIVILISLIGGRIIPAFTRNWLIRQQSTTLPAPFGRFDIGAILLTATGMLAWVFLPGHPITGAVLAAASLVQLARLARWGGWLTWREPLLLILHISYLFMPIGLAALAIATLVPELLSRAVGLHLLGIGLITAMTVSVMMRASAGHTGRSLTASTGLKAAFVALMASVAFRCWAEISSTHAETALLLATIFWCLAFGGFLAIVGPWLIMPRQDQT